MKKNKEAIEEYIAHYNPYHDPATGMFTSGAGIGSAIVKASKKTGNAITKKNKMGSDNKKSISKTNNKTNNKTNKKSKKSMPEAKPKNKNRKNKLFGKKKQMPSKQVIQENVKPRLNEIEKQKIIDSANIKLVDKYKDQMTYGEIQNALNRIDQYNRIANVKQLSKSDRIGKLLKKTEDVTRAINVASNATNAVDNLDNAFWRFHETQVSKQLNTNNLKEVLDDIEKHPQKYSANDVQKITKRMVQLQKLRKIAEDLD